MRAQRSMRLRSRTTLRALMEQEGVSYAELATAARVHRSFVSHLMAGRATGCTEPVAERMAKQLGVPTAVLFEPRTRPATDPRD